MFAEALEERENAFEIEVALSARQELIVSFDEPVVVGNVVVSVAVSVDDCDDRTFDQLIVNEWFVH